jgi:hypothetical protein
MFGIVTSRQRVVKKAELHSSCGRTDLVNNAEVLLPSVRADLIRSEKALSWTPVTLSYLQALPRQSVRKSAKPNLEMFDYSESLVSMCLAVEEFACLDVARYRDAL